MTSLLYGHVSNAAVPADENIVRMTTAPVTPDAPPAMADSAPDINEVETDPNPLLGMATRQLASTWHEGQQYSPEWSGRAEQAHDRLVNERIASSGTAAAREAAGVFGHGTLSYAEGIEPVQALTDGARMGNEYFVTNPKTVQESAGNYMSVPPGSDQDTMSKVAATGKVASRDANAAAYQSFWEGFKNGN